MIFVFVALPMSVMAMTTISDNDLSAVTGQAGVSIGADITMNVSFGTIAWGDSDTTGFTGQTGGGWVGLKDGDINVMRIHLRSDSGMADLTRGYTAYVQNAMGTLSLGDFTTQAFAGTNADLGYQKAMLAGVLTGNQLLTIDVYTDSTKAFGKTAVRIGIPTFEIDMASMNAKVGLWSDVTTNSSFQQMGSIYVQNMVALLGRNNYVDISANDTASGVYIKVGNLTTSGNMVDKATFDAMSWGDADGLTLNSSVNAGYVGLTGVTVTAIKVAATLNINVATADVTDVNILKAYDATQYATFVGGMHEALAADNVQIKNIIGYLLQQAGIIGATSVDIALTADVKIGSMVATAALGTTKDLAGTQILGSLYLKNLEVAIPAYSAGVNAASWVTISAH